MLTAVVLALALQASPKSALPVPFQMPPVVLNAPGAGGVRIDAEGVFGNFYPAASGRRAPGVLLLGGSEGGLAPGAARQAQGLAQHGFAVLQLAYFGAPGTPKALVQVPLETFDRGLAWLASRPEVDGRRLAIVGTSKGAEAALLVASTHPELKAVVAASPSAVVWPGIDFTSREMKSSWTRGGRELPYLRYVTPPAGTPGALYIYTGYRLGFESLPQHPDAAIPVQQAGAALLLVCGGADTLWPSCPMAIAVRDRTRHMPAGGPVEVLSYAAAGHAVAGPPVDPATPGYSSLGALGGTPEANNAARQDAWPHALSFLDARLKP